MDVLLGKVYSFDNEVKESTPCVRGCGNKFRLAKINIETTAFNPNSREVRFVFLCCGCGNDIELRLIIDDDKVQPIFAQGEDRLAGIHFSFFANIPLNFDYANEEKKLYASEERKEVKKPINPNRIFRDRKRKSAPYCSSNSKPYGAFRKDKVEVEFIKREQPLSELEVLSGEFKEKYARHMAQYQRPEPMHQKFEKVMELKVSDYKIETEGRWPDWIDNRKPGKEIVAQQGEIREIKGIEPDGWSFDGFDDEFYDNDTSTR
jgi:hypothetical protein